MRRFRTLLAAAMVAFAASEVYAYDIYSMMISISDHLSNGGFVEVEVPFYDDDGLDEALAADRSSGVWINGYKAVDLSALESKNSAQSTGDAYWCAFYSTASAEVEVANPDDSWYHLTSSSRATYAKRTGTTAYVKMRIYPKPEVLLSGSVKVYVCLHIDKINSDFYDVESTRYITYTPPVLAAPTFMLAGDDEHVGMQAMTFYGKYKGDSYSYADPATNNTVSGTVESDGEYITRYVPVSNNPRKISINNYVNISKYQTLNIVTAATQPAYFMPSSFTATQNDDCNVELNWTIDADEYDRNYQIAGGNWVIQRADNSDFNNPVDVSSNISLGSKITYDKSYSFTDKTADLNLNGTYYYRIRRSDNSWQWNPGAYTTCSIPLTMAHRYIDSAEATLLDGRVSIKWTWDKGSIWSAGSKVYYVSHNLTQNTTSSPVALTTEQVEARCAEAQLPTINDYYSYTIYVEPGNGSYTKQTPIDVKAEIPLINIEMGHLTEFSASKGYYNDRVDLRWTTDHKAVEYFSILSRVNGSGRDYEQIATLEANTASYSYRYSDTRAVPGVIYDYLVRCTVRSGGEPVSDQGETDLGFRRPTGEINGRIAFENGQAEEGVIVTAEPAEESDITGTAMAIGDGGKLTVTNENLLAEDTDFTFQAWINPSSDTGTIAAKSGLFSLGIADNRLSLGIGDQTLTADESVDHYADGRTNFLHVSAVADPDTISLYINGDRVAKARRAYANAPGAAPLVLGDGFSGIIDEVRVWSKALDAATIKRDYNRYIVGNESGLAAYYTFDLCTAGHFFDISYHGLDYNENHGVIENATMERESVPGISQLGYRGISNSDGTYAIRSIPFSGNGMSYLIVPQNGSHTFSPVKELRYISTSASVHTVNFTDNSSFLVSGHVTYGGGTVPVEGVEFTIDGVTCTKKGQTILTDSKGYFEIEVPVGTHEVKAVKDGHIFDNEGRITNSDGTDRNYQDILTGVQLTDYTYIKYVGRLAGGAAQAELPVGYGLSTNNLGEGTCVKLRYQNDAYTLTAEEHTETEYHYRDGNDNVPPHNTVTFRDNEILIYPNPETGEFVAFVQPLNYAITVEAPGYESYTRQLSEEKDFSDYIEPKLDTYEYTEYVTQGEEKVPVKHTESLLYYLRQNFSVRVAPEIDVKQYRGYALPYFGEPEAELGDDNDKPATVLLYTEEGGYTLGRPVLVSGISYMLQGSVRESYTYRDALGQPVAGKEPDLVPAKDAIVEFTCGSDSPARVEADSLGVAYHTFRLAEPNIVTDPVATVTVKAKVGEEGTFFDWTNGAALLKDFIVMGSKRKGSTFVTAGPDQLLTVLRDPPGSNSYAYIEEGTTLSRKQTVQNYATISSSQDGSTSIGIKNVNTMTGIVQESKTEGGKGLNEYTKQGGTNTWVAHYTFTQGFQTSADPVWVGAVADLYIGHGTNLTYGECDMVQLVSAETFDKLSAQHSDAFRTYDNITPAGSPYRLISHAGMSSQLDYGTTFAYTQHHITNTLIPNLKTLRNTILLQKDAIDDNTALAMAAQTGDPVYVSKLEPTDPDFGKTDMDDIKKTGRIVEYKNYKMYLPKVDRFYSDTIISLNESVRLWEERIRDNEKAKLEAQPVQNYSFQGGGSRVAISESYAYTHTYGYVWSAGIVGTFTTGNSSAFNGIGGGCKISVKVDDYNGGERSNEVSETAKKGFVLADDNSTDYFSVDVLREKNDEMPVDQEGDIEMRMPNEGYKPAFVFRTKGGASSCPYEGERVTQYFNPGTILDEATLQVEGPMIVAENPFVENVPSGEDASILLRLGNNSDIDCNLKFYVKELEDTNPDGLVMTIDGAQLNGGYSLFIPSGQIIYKTLSCRKGRVLNYDNIGVKLTTSFEGQGIQEEINDKTYFSVHFVPGASAVNIARPATNWTYNTNLPSVTVNGVKKHYMDIEMDGFDTGYENFTCLRLQYKPSSAGDDEWINLCTYYADETLYNEAIDAGKTAALIAAGTDKLYYKWYMDELMDQNYDLRAIGVSTINNVEHTNPSAVRSGIKDMYNPRPFGQPQPASGILGIDDEIRVNFNEPIAEGYLTNNNFSVTGIRNGAATDHSVSVEIQNAAQALRGDFARNFAGKDLTVEMWIKPSETGAATWFDIAGDEGLRFGITADNKLTIACGDWQRTGSVAVDAKAQEWAHVALVYDRDGNVEAYYNFASGLTAGDAPQLPETGKYTFGTDFRGNLHNARLWTIPVRGITLKSNSLVKLSGREKDLMAYYPMDEGRGATLTDRAHSANMPLGGAQWTLPAGKAAQLGGSSYVKLDTGAAVIDSSMDFTAEMWFKGDASNANATLLSNGAGDGRDEICLGFENGVLRYVNNGIAHEASGNWLDNAWHHVAVAVSRTNGRGQICVDGELNSYFSAENVGGMGAAFAAVGARLTVTDGDATADRLFTGSVDDVRLWSVYRNDEILAEGCNRQLAGDEIGLMAYYPFERYIEYQGTPELVFSLADTRIVAENASAAPDAVAVGATASQMATAACAPVKGTGEVSKLLYDFVVNSDAIIITLNEDLNRIENTVVNFSVDGVRDLNGNKLLSPITWSAYIDRNQLNWSTDRVNLSISDGESATFDADVVNGSGRNINYTVSGLPSWLEVSSASGKIGPATRETLTFTVTDAVPIGSYNEYIYLTGDNDVSEALALNLKVNGTKPDWSVNPADFKFSMNMVGRIMTGSTYSRDTEDMVGVFKGGRCVGVANNSYIAQNDSYEALLTIYSDIPTSQTALDFYLWDASTGETLVLTPSETVTFRQNTLVGSIEDPVRLVSGDATVQYIPLEQGWTWISVGVNDPGLGDLAKVLDGYDWSANDMIKSESEGIFSYHNDGYWIGSLSALSTGLMYHVYTQHPMDIHFGGTRAGGSINVLGATSDGTPRWTYLPYWPSVKMPVNEAMAGYEASAGDILKGQTRFAVYSDNLGWVGNLTAMEPGRGYMLRRSGTTDATLTYAQPATKAPRDSDRTDSDATGTNPYAANMTVVGALKGIDAQPGDRLLAYINGEERGSAVIAEIGGEDMFFLTIAGDTPDMVDVALERGGSVTDVLTNAIDYSADKSYGTAEAPYVIDFDRANAATVYPTLVTETVNVDINAAAPTRACVEVLDVTAAHMAVRSLDLDGDSAHLVIDVSSWPSGFYFVSVTFDDRREVYKIVKK